MNRLLLLLSFLLFYTIQVSAQLKLDVKPVLAMQFWGASSAGTFDYSNNVDIDSRVTFQLRRSRIGIKGSINKRLRFALVGASDNVGKDLYDGVVGGPNNGPSPRIRLWDAYGAYKVNENNDLLHITFGYFAPRISRESITSPFKVNSLEKSWTQNYIRRHQVGTGPGRTIGLNLGGMKRWEEYSLGFSYDVGIFNPLYTVGSAVSSGQKSSNIIALRTALHIGDPDVKNYTAGRLQNYFGNRKGITVAYSISQQGAGESWDNNNLSGWDLMANWGPLSLMGEWIKMTRDLRTVAVQATTWVVKMGINHTLANNRNIEAVFSYAAMNGGTAATDLNEAIQLGTFSGEDNYSELTLNYYPSSKVKFQLAYTWRNGSSGNEEPTLARNNYFNQSGIIFERPNYLALAWNITI